LPSIPSSLPRIRRLRLVTPRLPRLHHESGLAPQPIDDDAIDREFQHRLHVLCGATTPTERISATDLFSIAATPARFPRTRRIAGSLPAEHGYDLSMTAECYGLWGLIADYPRAKRGAVDRAPETGGRGARAIEENICRRHRTVIGGHRGR